MSAALTRTAPRINKTAANANVKTERLKELFQGGITGKKRVTLKPKIDFRADADEALQSSKGERCKPSSKHFSFQLIEREH